MESKVYINGPGSGHVKDSHILSTKNNSVAYVVGKLTINKLRSYDDVKLTKFW